MQHRRIRSLAAIAAAAFAVVPVQAAFITWLGTTTASWSDASQWSTGTVPGANDDVFFTSASGNNYVTLDGDRFVRSLTVTNPAGDPIFGGLVTYLTLGAGQFTSTTSSDYKLSANFALGSNGNFTFNGTGTVTLAGIINQSGGTRSLTKNGTGRLKVQGVASGFGGYKFGNYSGGTFINAGTIDVDSYASLGAGGVSVASGSTLGAYNNAVFHEGTTIHLAGNGQNSAGSFHAYPGARVDLPTVNLTASTTLNIEASAEVNVAQLTESASSTLAKNGAGTLIFSAPSNRTGLTIINQGIVALTGGTNALGTGTILINGGQLSVAGGTTSAPIQVTAQNTTNPAITGSGTINSPIILQAPVALRGSTQSTLVLAGVISSSNPGTNLIIDGRVGLANPNNSYLGNTVVESGGRIDVLHNTAIPANSNLVVNSGGSVYIGNNVTVARDIGLSGGSLGVTTDSTGSWTGNIQLVEKPPFDVVSLRAEKNSRLNISGNISGSLLSYLEVITHSDTGFVTLSGTGSFTAPYVGVKGGNLVISSSAAMPATVPIVLTTDIVSPKASLTLSGFSTLSAPVRIDSAGVTLASTSGNNTLTGALDLNQPFTVNVKDGTLGITSSLTESPTITKTGVGTLVLSNSNNGIGQLTINQGTVRVAGVPLGAASGNSVAVNPSGTLEIAGASNPTGAVVILSGNGYSNNGSFRAVSGNSVWNGNLLLTASSGYSGGSVGTETYSNLTINGAIGELTPGSTLTKLGNGTVILTQPSSHTGATGVRAGTLQISADNQLGLNSTVEVSGSGRLKVASSMTTTRTFDMATTGQLTVDAGAFLTYGNGAVVSGGLLGGSGTHAATTGASFYGSRLTQGANLTQQGVTTFTQFTNSGNLTINGFTSYSGYNDAAGRINVNSSLTVTGLQNSGTLNVNPTASLNVSGIDLVIAAGGQLKITAGASAMLSGANIVLQGGLFANNGTLSGNGTVEVGFGAVARGTGTYNVPVNVTDGGVFAPGNSPGSVTVSQFAMDKYSVIEMELAGLELGTTYDHMNITVAGHLDGTLKVTVLPGFTPLMGHTFDLFDFTNTTGTFDEIILPTPFPGTAWNTSQLYSTGVISLESVLIPEPAALLPMLAATTLLQRRRRR